jgi:hypothetical protein
MVGDSGGTNPDASAIVELINVRRRTTFDALSCALEKRTG